ncbi:hypothetical protein NX786_16725 [Telluria mixta]|uniref:Uncharacterized protein n=1 Tax=Telluria mixta TaxID=34071 RepID=A0ABT2C0R9_9BURK|nr:hypothetical protein [Telluria mixta]MCS0630978.1 hypothetical protein [Telluria mixta]WEM98976.1 hypothetical protein P0M04_15100 [Telluria mixta]
MHTPATTRHYGIRALLLLTLATAISCRADDDVADPADEPLMRTLRLDEDTPKALRWDLYFSGYAYHDRATYSKAQLRKINEMTLGGGLGRSLRDERGNESAIFVLGIRDSNERPQWMAGYAYQWMFPLKSQGGLEYGIGLSALVIRRHDWHDGRPFPAVLPIASIGGRSAQLLATYVPRLAMFKKKGNVLSLVLKFSM